MYKSMENDFHSNFALAAPYKARKMGEDVALFAATQLVIQSAKQKPATNARSAMLAYA